MEVYMLKTRCGSDTYIKPDGKVGTAGKGALVSEEVSFTLAASQDQTMVQVEEEEPEGQRYVVRRLTPVECERLQGFPDGWTDLTGCDVEAVTARVAAALRYEEGSDEWRKLHKSVEKWSAGTPDTPRYKAMGNSMTTHVIEKLGRRIQAYDELHGDEIGRGDPYDIPIIGKLKSWMGKRWPHLFQS